MKLFVQKVILSFLFISTSLLGFGQSNKEEKVADYYFRSNNLKKAIEFYEKLILNEDKDVYYQRLLTSYVKLGENKKAKDLIISKLENDKKNPFYLADYSCLLFVANDDAYLKYFKKTLKFLPRNIRDIKFIATKFTEVKAYDEAVLIYEKGEKLFRDNDLFVIEKSSLKGLNGDIQNMISTYLNLLNQNTISVERTKFYISRFTTFTTDKEEANQINKLLLLFAQQYPENNDYLELLVWFYAELENYNGAFKNLKVLYRRNPEDFKFFI